MSAQAVGKLPLNHYLTEVPSKNACSLKCKAFALDVLSKISCIAFIAIMAAVFTIAYGGIAVTGAASLILAGLVITSPLSALGWTQFSSWSSQFSRRAEHEAQVVLQLGKIANWKTPQVEQFLRDQGLDLARIPLDALRQINRDEPLLALLPLIARFNYFKESAQEIEQSSKKCLAEQCNDIEDQDKRRLIRYINRQEGWRLHEHVAIPRAFDAAVMLHVIQLPTITLDLAEHVGNYRAKAFDERMLDRSYEPIDDDYFVFHPDLLRDPLKLNDIEQNMDPRALRLQLFPNLIRA